MLKMLKIVFFLCLGVWGASAATHTLQYFFTATSGIPNFPEFISLGMVDGQQTDYYDSNLKRAAPKVEWMNNVDDPEYWSRQTQISVGAEQNFKNNINLAQSRFNQTGGVHTVQRIYGCEWDDQTRATNGFFQEGYDGEDFLFLDLKELRWISPVPQGALTVEKWNNDKAQAEYYKQYFSSECIEWLQKYVQYGKSSLEKTVSPQVSLLQKSSPSPVTCHATGFYPSGVTITWMRNGQEHLEDVEIGELLPNEDGTFQKRSTITVTPDEWKKNKFSCVVEHKGKTKTADEIRTNAGDSVPIGIIVGVVVGVVAAVVLLTVIGVTGFMVYQKKEKSDIKTSTDSTTSLISSASSDSSSVGNTKDPETCDRIKSLTSLNPDPDHGYNSGSDNNSCNGSHSGSDSTSDIASVCSDNGSKNDA